MKDSRRFLRFVSSLTCVLLVKLAVSAPAQEEEKNEPVKRYDFPPYLRIVGSEYVPPDRAGGSQLVRLKFDLSPEVPVKTKIYLELLYNGLPEETALFELKTDVRKGLTFDWRSKKALGVGEYTLFSSIPLDQQPPGVLELLRKRTEALPFRYEPWAWTYSEENESILVGTPEEAARQKAQALQFYRQGIVELTKNQTELLELLDAVREGKKFKKGDLVDEQALAVAIKNWCKKQALTQKSIKDFILEKPALWSSTMLAHYHLEGLGRMVSKRAWKLQEDLAGELALEPFTLERDPKDKSDEVLKYYSRFHLQKANEDSVERIIKTIHEALGLKAENEGKNEQKNGGKRSGAKKRSGGNDAPVKPKEPTS